jgi:tellurite resistance protein TehA-like permease
MRPDTDVFRDAAPPRWWQSGRQWATMAVRHANPGWFTSVMGTGILAVCAALSPVALPMLHQLSMVIWVGAVALLAIITLCWLTQSIQQPQRLRLSLTDPVSAQFWGAPPIACFTISLGFLVIGPHVLSTALCIAIAQELWILGVIGSLFSIVLVPYLMAIKQSLSLDATSGSWLLPVVPPIVAGVPEGLLAAH